MEEKKIKTPLLIIGGGIGGLCLAWQLQKQDQPFLVIEQKNSCGGNIGKIGEAIALGPKIFLASRAKILKQLAIELEVPFDIILEKKKRYLFHKGKLQSVMKVALPYLLKFLIKHLALKEEPLEETFEAFFSKRMGQKGVDCVISPILHGIYAEGPKDLCIDALMPQLKHKGGLKNLFKKKERGLFVFENGAFELIQKLQSAMGDNLLLNTRCEQIHQEENRYLVQTNQGMIQAEQIVLATQFHALKQLLEKSNLMNQTCFERFETTSVDVVHFVFDQKQKRPKGSGFLIAPKEGYKILGALFDADLNKKIEGDVLSVFIKGSNNPKKEAFLELKTILKEIDEPNRIYLNSYPEKIFKCQKGDAKAIQDIKNHLQEKRIFLLGAYPKVGVCDVLAEIDPLVKKIFNLSTR